MASKYISLIRHGDYGQLSSVPSAFQPFPLNAKGQEEAFRAISPIKKFIQDNELKLHSVIYSSELLRAWQTAEIIRLGLALDPLQISSTIQLAERCVGSVANLTVSEIEAILVEDPRYESPPQGWKSDSFYSLPFHGAESLMQAGKRVSEYLMKVEQKLPINELAVVVGHGAAIRHAAYHLGFLKQKQIAQLSMYHGVPVIIEIDDNKQWRHVSGNWKVREKIEQPD